MRVRRLLCTIGMLIAAGSFSPSAGAGVVVLTNRAKDKVSCTVVQPDGRQSQQELLHDDVVSLPTAGSLTVAFHDGVETRRYLLRANGIYYFLSEGKRLALLQQPIPGLSALPADSPAPKPAAGPRDSLCVIPVKLLADDKEPRVRRLWEKEYRERLAEASAVFERCCRIRFQVVAVDRWKSDDNAHDFFRLVAEFDRQVNPEPAKLAIGFTGQYAGLQEDKRMGASRGPFRSHVLIREWGRQITESERLEILVHELGHYLGAVHSPEPQSVMRPDFSDRQSRARSFRIRFDAANALVISLLGEEMRNRPIERLGQLPAAVKDQLRPLYQSLAAGLPNDPAAPAYLAMLDQSLGLAGSAADHQHAVISAARSVVQAITEAARENDRLLSPGRPAAGGQPRREGNKLTEYYVRAAAAAARRLPSEIAGKAFLLALGVALDDSPLLTDTPVLGEIWQRIEPPEERAQRLAVLGSPTMRNRRDSAQHFSVSAALTVLVGPQAAEGAGIIKEISDAQGGSGFSFVDLAADFAGVTFATAVSNGRLPLSRVEAAFAVDDFLPSFDGLKEGIAWRDFIAAYGSSSDERWLRQRQAIRQRIAALPGYKQ